MTADHVTEVVPAQKTDDPTQATAYKIIDRRTGKRASQATFGPLWYAHRQIVNWRHRDRKGGRPDVHDMIPFLACAIEDGVR